MLQGWFGVSRTPRGVSHRLPGGARAGRVGESREGGRAVVRVRNWHVSRMFHRQGESFAHIGVGGRNRREANEISDTTRGGARMQPRRVVWAV